jgi:dTDP-4-dehydrorhamnose 3,5-epimerase
MRFLKAPLAGAMLIELERHEDERGFFARTWSQEEFAAQGLATRLVQCSISYNLRRGTLRGMHYQLPPFAEDKLVRVTHGRIYDVLVDLHPDSDTFLKWYGVELSRENRLSLYVPQGFAHGFETLADDTEVYYQMSESYAPDHARGFRWDDPKIGLTLPEPVAVIAERDRTFPDIRPDEFAAFAGSIQAKQ